MADISRQLVATDKLVTRDRFTRNLVLIAWIFTVSTTCALVGQVVVEDWFQYGIIGFFGGLIAAALILRATLPRFFVQVDAARGFVTINNLRAYLGRGSSDDSNVSDDHYVVYGPGIHTAYPWESREKDNNFSLEEATEKFQATVQTKTGVVTISGSVRLRPDLRYLPKFKGGAAAVAGDVVGLVVSHVSSKFSDKTVDEAIQMHKQVSADLTKDFGVGNKTTASADVSSFEERFGVDIGDVTLEQILPSKEAQKTRSAIDEAAVISLGTAVMLGFTTVKKMKEALEKGALTQKQIDEARKQFMAASENIAMTVEANSLDVNLNVSGIDLSGLDPNIAAKAAGAVANAVVSNKNRGRTSGQPKGGAK